MAIFNRDSGIGKAVSGFEDASGINLGGIPVFGPMFGSQADEQMKQALAQAAAAIAAYRPVQAQNYQNIQSNALAAYAPAADLLQQIYGAKPPPDTPGHAYQVGAMGGSPVSTEKTWEDVSRDTAKRDAVAAVGQFSAKPPKIPGLF